MPRRRICKCESAWLLPKAAVSLVSWLMQRKLLHFRMAHLQYLITTLGGMICCEVISQSTKYRNPCILKIMLSHRNHVVLTKMKWVCFIFLWNLTTNTLMVIYSSSSSPPSSSAFSAIMAVDWKTPRACKWTRYQRGQASLVVSRVNETIRIS